MFGHLGRPGWPEQVGSNNLTSAWRRRAAQAIPKETSVTETTPGPGEDPIQVTPVVVLVQMFPARPSSIPDIRDFVRRCLAESPLTEEGTREVGETVFRALLDAAGPTGSIQVAFRIFPEHVEVDVLHSDNQIQPLKAAPNGTRGGLPGDRAGAGPAVTTAALPGVPGSTPDTSVARAATEVAGGEGLAGTVPPGTPGHPDTFADWMSMALRREGLTQEAAARMLGVSVKTVSRWVGGATEPRMRDLRRIQELFGEIPIS
jgi:DNA-binding XRE family transcriptional regulator